MSTPSSPTFLRSQDADATSPSDAASDTATEQTSKKSSRGILFAILGFLVIAGAVGGFLFFRHHKTTRSANTSAAVKQSAPIATVDLPLDPFVVNLADTGGHSYARIGLTLQLAAPDVAGKKEKKEASSADASGSRAMVRDTVITVLNQEPSTDLLAPGGKEHLKQAIRSAVAARDPQVEIIDIYFTEFLIQQ
jgi:flagellar FliL protein